MFFFLLSGAKNDEALGSTKVNCLISYNLLGCVTLTFSRNFIQHFWNVMGFLRFADLKGSPHHF